MTVQAMQATSTPLDELNKLVDQFLENHPDIPALVLGVVTPKDLDSGETGAGPHTYKLTKGVLEPGGTDPPQTNTLFQINSVTKTFTGTALAWLASEGLVEITDPVQNYVPGYSDGGFTLPIWTQSTPRTPVHLVDLADFQPGFPHATFKAYGPLFDWVSNKLQLTSEPGTVYLYCDAAFELLGATLSYARGKKFDYPTLLTEMLKAGQFDMPDTVVYMTKDQQSRLASGYSGDPPKRDADSPGDWLIHSTLDDMTVWLQFNLGLFLSSPFTKLLSTIQQEWGQASHAGLGWFIGGFKDYPTCYSKDGGGGGFNSYIACAPDYENKSGTGVVAMVNYDKGDMEHLVKEVMSFLART